jgi:hypothetical protein
VSRPAPLPRPSRKKIICPDAGVPYPAQEEHPEKNNVCIVRENPKTNKVPGTAPILKFTTPFTLSSYKYIFFSNGILIKHFYGKNKILYSCTFEKIEGSPRVPLASILSAYKKN